MRYAVLAMFALGTFAVFAQQPSDDVARRKRIIDEVEILAGPSSCFNYGNKFIENYQDANVRNKRLSKLGYVAGIGIYHPITDRVSLNLRWQFERKGRKTELNSPLSSGRVVNYDDYNYDYFTWIIAPRIALGVKRNWTVSIGAYYSRIHASDGYSKTYNTANTYMSEGHDRGRFFYHLRDDGTMDSFTWSPSLKSFQPSDIGSMLSVGYSIHFNDRSSLMVQLVDNLGLKNINSSSAPYGQKEKNHTVSFVVSYHFIRTNKK